METISFHIMRFMRSFISVIIILYHVQATAGLRALGHEASENILQAVIVVKTYDFCFCSVYTKKYNFVLKVRELLKDRSRLKTEANAVSVLDGTQGGSYQWVCCLILS